MVIRTSVQVLPAYQGDCLIITFQLDAKILKILVDAGPKKNYVKGVLKNELAKLSSIDLVILTHTDDDHIGGLVKYYEDKNRKINLFKKIWFNSGVLIEKEINAIPDLAKRVHLHPEDDLNMSIRNSVTLEKEMQDEKNQNNILITTGYEHDFDSILIQVLSPELDDLKSFYKVWEIEYERQLNMGGILDREDTIEDLIKKKFKESGSPANKTSLAILVSHSNASILLMGDAFPSVIERAIRKLGYDESNPLEVDLVKISHHGSAASLSPELLKIINCKKFVISTDGSNGLPNKECLARIISSSNDKKDLIFNYKNEIITSIFSNDDLTKYNFGIHYLNENNNYTIDL